MESSNGVSLFATSNGSLDLFPNNCAAKFTNNLKSEIKLNPDVNYEIRLTNLHSPKFEAILVKDDFEHSYIRYNLGVFQFDDTIEGRYKLDKSSVRTLFTLAPNQNINGLFENENLQKFNFESPDNDFITDFSGLPSLRALKDSFMIKLGHSLRIKQSDPLTENEKNEAKILSYFKETLKQDSIYASSSNLRGPFSLLGRWYSDLNYFMFSEYNFMTKVPLFEFISKLMHYAKISGFEYAKIISKVSLLTETMIEQDFNIIPKLDLVAIAEMKPPAFVAHIRKLETKCNISNTMFHGFSDIALRKIHRKGANLEEIYDIINRSCTRNENLASHNLAPIETSSNTNDATNTNSTSSNNLTNIQPNTSGQGIGDNEISNSIPNNVIYDRLYNMLWPKSSFGRSRNITTNLRRRPRDIMSSDDENIDNLERNTRAATRPNRPSHNTSRIRENVGPYTKPNKKVKKYMDATSENNKKNTPFIGVFITFGKNMARFFNVDVDQFILIANYGFSSVQWKDFYLKLTPNFTKKKIDKMMIYSDLVCPTIRVGGHLTNLLDIVSVPNESIIQKQLTSGHYRPLKNHKINSVSMMATDQDGEIINFEKNSHIAYELDIRPIQ